MGERGMSRFITCCYGHERPGDHERDDASGWQVIVSLQDPFRVLPDKALVVRLDASFDEVVAWREKWFDSFPLKEDFDDF